MLDLALRYADAGYPVFPCVPSAKPPLTANGFKDATTDAETIEKWWTANPAANVAIATAGLLVVDIDTLPDGSPNQWLVDDPDKLMDLAAAPLSRTPRRGRHFVFRQPAGMTLRNTAGKLSPHVDTRADGGYILVAPSVVDGKLYRWVTESTLADTPREQLPEPPTWLIELLTAAAAPKREPKPAAELIPLDATKPGDDFCARATWQDILTPHGWLYCGERQGVQRWTRPGKDDGVSATAGHCKSDAGRDLFYCFTPNAPPLEAGKSYSKFAAYATLEHGGDFGAAASALAAKGFGAPRVEVCDDPEPAPARPTVGKFPPHLLRAPGFISDVIDWNLAGAQKPQPILALGGALCLLSALTGRKVSDPFGTRTNIYCIAVADSGSGKERARKVIKRVLFNSGLGNRLKENPASHTGIINAIDDAPESTLLFLIDEMGELLATLTGHNAPAHLRGIMRVLMSLFTSSDEVYMGDSYAEVKRQLAIVNPHLSLFGATVHKSLYEAFTGDSVSNGFLSRMLIFESESGPQRGRQVEPPEMPDSLIQTAKYWAEFQPPGYGNLSDKKSLAPLVVQYTAEARQIMEDLETLAYNEQIAREGATAVLWTRLREKAHKLALLYACSANHVEPLIGRDAAKWGAELAEFLTRKMLAIADAWIAETPFQARRKRVLRTIKAAASGLTQAALTRATQHLTNRERTEILDSLLTGGEVRQEVVKTSTRPRTVYVAA